MKRGYYFRPCLAPRADRRGALPRTTRRVPKPLSIRTTVCARLQSLNYEVGTLFRRMLSSVDVSVSREHARDVGIVEPDEHDTLPALFYQVLDSSPLQPAPLAATVACAYRKTTISRERLW